MADYGIKISKVGESVTSTDPRDHNKWSKYPILKIDKELDSSFTSDNVNVGKLTINHALGYNPEILFYYQETTVGSADPGMLLARSNYDVATNDVTIVNTAADKNNVYVYFPYLPGGGDLDFDYHYYLIYDQAINT